MKGTILLNMIDNISEDKKISKEIIINSIKEGFTKSYEKQHPNSIVKVNIDEFNGQLKLFVGRKVVEKISEEPETEENEHNTILFSEATLLDPEIKLNDIMYEELKYEEFNRSSAIQVAQILRQQIREAEKKSIYEEYKDRINEIISGKVVTIKDNYYLLEVGRTFAFLPKKNTLSSDNFDINDNVKFYVEDISETSKNSGQILGSRINNEFLQKILEQEIPEIFEGIVKIKSIARDPGVRSKISVFSENANIDPVGTCVGIHGSRIKKIINELNGENIDVCKWSDNLEEYIKNIFSIVNILRIDEIDDTEVNLIVPKDQLSLAIGKKGRTIKLCATLLNKKLNVLSDELDSVKEKSIKVSKIEENIENTPEVNLKNDLSENASNEDNVLDDSLIKEINPDNEITTITQEDEISELDKKTYDKYKNQFSILTEKIGILNDKKYEDNILAKEIKIKFIDLFSYFNDYDSKTITTNIFQEIQDKINFKTLKNYCDFVNDNLISDKSIEPLSDEIEKSEDTDTADKVIANLPKTEKIDEELHFYSKIEDEEQEIDNEYYDSIDYDDYDQYYD